MTNTKTYLLLTLIPLAFLISACSGQSLTAASWPGLLVDDDTAYIAFNTQVYAVDLSTQNLKWSYPNEPENNLNFYAEPAITSDGQLIIGDFANNLHSLNPATGQENRLLGSWPFTDAENRFIAGSLTTDKGIFAPSADGKLYALDLEGKQALWNQPFQTDEALWAKPNFDGKFLYQPSMDHHIYKVDIETGQMVWKRDLGFAMVGTPALSEDGMLYVGTFGNELVAINSADGDIVWRYETQDWVWSGPAIDEERLYFGDLSGSFYGLNRTNGKEIWPPIRVEGAVAGTPLVTDEGIYFATEEGFLYSINPDSSLRWGGKPVEVDGELYSSPVSNGSMVLVTPNQSDCLLVGVDQNGASRCLYNPESD